MSLRELIHSKHEEAEHHPFTKSLFSGNLPKTAYGDFLFNTLQCYSSLESICESRGLFNGIEHVKRVDLMKKDLACFDESYTTRKCTLAYIDHINKIDSDQDLMAHVYVRYMGDLYGGQMIKRVVPSSGHMYEFENRKELIENIRSKLTDDMGDEANVCFQFVIDLYQELSNEYNL